jgi:hypothetical protein
MIEPCKVNKEGRVTFEFYDYRPSELSAGERVENLRTSIEHVKAVIPMTKEVVLRQLPQNHSEK